MEYVSESIANLDEHKDLVQQASVELMAVEKALGDNNVETAAYWAGKLSLTIHKIQQFDFVVERKKVTANNLF